MGAFTNTFSNGVVQLGSNLKYDALIFQEPDGEYYFMSEEDDSDYYLKEIPQ